MKKIYLTLLVGAFCYTPSFGQSKPLLGQYFQNMPAFAPALTGANDYLDLRLSIRQQWVGLEGTPSTVFVSGYTSISSKEAKYRQGSLRIGTEEDKEIKPKFKHGVGGYFQSNKLDLFKQLEFNLNYAAHVPVFRQAYLSLGVSGGLANERIDISNIRLKNSAADNTYQSLQNNGASNSFFNISGGIALYSDRYYLAYSALPLVRLFVSGNETLNQDQNYIRQQILAGGRFHLNQDIEMIPNGFLRIDRSMPVLLDAGLRFRYQKKYWAGLSYRNDGTLISMLGLTLKDLWNLSYSYEYGFGDYHSFNNGTHEVVLGVQLFNYKRYTSMW